jgi:GH15 family glucan-1,4-alpha-glucosidase
LTQDAYPPLSSYGLLGDGRAAALVSRAGSIDWCCVPRFDSGSCFGRLLDWKRGGFCSIAAVDPGEASREYVEESLVLATSFRVGGGHARVLDAFVLDPAGDDARRQLLRVVEGVRGAVELEVRVEPRFDYGQVRPWIRREGSREFSAVGGNDALLIAGDVDLEPDGQHALAARITVHAGERARLWLAYAAPADLEGGPLATPRADELDRRLEATLRTWQDWAGRGRPADVDRRGVLRSALTLKALSYDETGAIAAAATTSLPEAMGGARNWDYRFSWIRDSSFAVRSLAEIGFEREADAFRRFIHRSSAGNADDLQVMFGVGGERRLPEQQLELEGYRGSAPVRVGNGAAGQLQLDAFGEILGLVWRWHARGHSPDDDAWRFLVSLVDFVAEHWSEPDCGLWEWRGDPLHFVHSKALCWSALDRGIRLAEECLRRAPTRRWSNVRAEIRDAVESEGYDAQRGVYVQAFGRAELDSALLLLPLSGYLDWADERMARTADAIREELGAGDGLLYRYRRDDGLGGKEGAFLACSFWLVEVLARQERATEAREVFDAATATANDLGLFSEEWDADAGEMLGNVPQALTHLSHIAAAVALAQAESTSARPTATAG